MHPGPSLIAVGIMVLGVTVLAAVFARQVDADTRLSRIFLLLATAIGTVALLAGVLFVVIA